MTSIWLPQCHMIRIIILHRLTVISTDSVHFIQLTVQQRDPLATLHSTSKPQTCTTQYRILDRGIHLFAKGTSQTVLWNEMTQEKKRKETIMDV